MFAKALLELALNKSDQGLRIEGSGRTGLEAAIAWQPSVAKTEYLPSVVGCRFHSCCEIACSSQTCSDLQICQ